MIIVTLGNTVKAKVDRMQEVLPILNIEVSDDGKIFYGDPQIEYGVKYNMKEFTKEEVRIDLARCYAVAILNKLGYKVYMADELK